MACCWERVYFSISVCGSLSFVGMRGKTEIHLRLLNTNPQVNLPKHVLFVSSTRVRSRQRTISVPHGQRTKELGQTSAESKDLILTGVASIRDFLEDFH